jgi:hypothetical protein
MNELINGGAHKGVRVHEGTGDGLQVARGGVEVRRWAKHEMVCMDVRKQSCGVTERS